MQKTEIDKIIQLVTEKIPSMQAIYLFGSQSTEIATSHSDVDLAFLTTFDCKISSVEVYKVQLQLEATLGKDVDFVHLNQASTVFQFEITTTARHLYIKDASLVLQYESLILSMYQRLQEERKGILNEIISSGKVYA